MFVELLTPIGNAFNNVNDQLAAADRAEQRNMRANEMHNLKRQEMMTRLQSEQQKLEAQKQRDEDRHALALQNQTLNTQRIEKNEMYLSSKRAGYAQSMEELQTAFSRGNLGLQLPPQ